MEREEAVHGLCPDVCESREGVLNAEETFSSGSWLGRH